MYMSQENNQENAQPVNLWSKGQIDHDGPREGFIVTQHWNSFYFDTTKSSNRQFLN
jgi:hypothetical protein